MPPRLVDLKVRTKQFALDTLRFVRDQPPIGDTRGIRQQLIGAATSTAANYRAACRARSRAEFVAKIGVALEEADEAAFWLELLLESGLVAGEVPIGLLREANELCAILSASSLTAKANTTARGR